MFFCNKSDGIRREFNKCVSDVARLLFLKFHFGVLELRCVSSIDDAVACSTELNQQLFPMLGMPTV